MTPCSLTAVSSARPLSSCLDQGQFTSKAEVTAAVPGRALLARSTVVFSNIIGHFDQRGSGEENLVRALVLHEAGIVERDRPPTAAEDHDVADTATPQLPDDFGKEIDMPAVVARDPDGSDVFLDGGAHNVARITMKAEINDLDAMADELEVDCIDGTVVAIANWYRCELE